MDKIFGPLDKAAAGAYQGHNKVFKFQGNPDLSRYEQLRPSDLETLVNKYGVGPVTEYVTAMESRKLKGA